MKYLNHVKGVQGEVISAEYLKNKKYKILEKNYTTKIGEIDLIAQYNDIIVFVEVKERATQRYGLPREAVTPYKQNKIRLVASQYLLSKNMIDAKVRFDVIEILGDSVTHIENAFWYHIFNHFHNSNFFRILYFVKKISFKRKWLFSLVTNLIIVVMIFTVFGVCFLTDSSVVVSSSGYKAIYRGNENNKNVSLCINIYWGTEYVLDMLNILDEADAKATFFVGGTWASQNVDILKEIYSRGHEIANHGYYHKDHKLVDYARNVQEIDYTHKLVKELLGIDMKLFMPPSGSYGTQTLEAAENLGYTTIMWSKDTIDWRDKDTNLIYTRATKNLQNGDIILMHPTECTKNALKNILDFYKTAGFSAVTVSENIA